MTEINDLAHVKYNALNSILKNIDAMDRGNFLPPISTASVLQFLGASTFPIGNDREEYKGYGIPSGFLHPDEILVATCRHLENEKALSYEDMPQEAHRWMNAPRPSAFALMKKAEEGDAVKEWEDDRAYNGSGGYSSIMKRITEAVVFDMFKLQCEWTHNPAVGDSTYIISGYRVIVI